MDAMDCWDDLGMILGTRTKNIEEVPDYVNVSTNWLWKQKRKLTCLFCSKRNTWISSREVFLGDIAYGSILTEKERKVAEEANQRTLRILFDALEKKDSVLVEKCGDANGLLRQKNCPMIPMCLVQDLITKLQNVEFRKREYMVHESYDLTDSDKIIIYLSPHFWLQKETLDIGSRPGTLILAAAQILGYKYYAETPTDEGHVQQHPPTVPLSAYSICSAFESWMRHRGLYSGSYSCCGEESRDSVCAISDLSIWLNDIAQL
ncbi:uncharacterized protein LOC108701268 [Xenopus laevis]|uniref:Uncharacterized protein LOC108701268 n=1 Tax=Xenopus laevis TaxID=8355 RepID=A0A8J0TU37_XENLA|nr:uncharacterized protein LOC108701268 [Xenopus laevis]